MQVLAAARSFGTSENLTDEDLMGLMHTPPAPAPTPEQTAPIYGALDLTRGGNTAQILLGDQVYTLRVTKAGKLILTK